jgi:outer membrane protein, heavy metal efflux system
VSLPGLRPDMPASMAPGIQLTQTVPFPGTLSLAGRIAGKTTETARAQSLEVWWELRAQAAMLFYQLYSYDAQLRVMAGTEQLLQESRQTAIALFAAGTGRQSDVLRANLETAKLQVDFARMRVMRSGAAARLNALLNRSDATAIDSVTIGTIATSVPALDSLQAWAERGRPALIQARALVEQAQLQRSLASRDVWPDLTVGLEYGRHRTERLASVMVGFTVPLFAVHRQLRMRDEASALEQMARAELAATRAKVTARLRELHATIEANTRLADLYRTSIIPQAKANAQSALSAYRNGSVDFMTLLDAELSWNRYRQELYALIAERGTALAQLELAIGRELPAGQPWTVEEP